MRAIIAASCFFAASESARVRSGKQNSCGILGSTAGNETSISIVNGDDAPQCKWKWQVGLTRSRGGSPFCGGMLISEDWVLTAAHCMVFSSFWVSAGEWKPSTGSPYLQTRAVQRTFSHPSYSSRSMEYDIALVKLSTPVDLNNCVGTVCLPTSDVLEETCWITGWGTLSSGGGRPSTLQEAKVTTLNNTACQATGYSARQITDDMLCAQGRTSNGAIIDACQGDSGGPLACERNGRWEILGATSWGRGCAGRNYPGVWARVHENLDWIHSTMDDSN